MERALRVVVQPRRLPPAGRHGSALARGGGRGAAHRSPGPAHVAPQEHGLVAGRPGGRGRAGVRAGVALGVEGPRGEAGHCFAVCLSGSRLLTNYTKFNIYC